MIYHYVFEPEALQRRMLCTCCAHAVHMLCTLPVLPRARASHVNVPSDVATTDSRGRVGAYPAPTLHIPGRWFGH